MCENKIGAFLNASANKHCSKMVSLFEPLWTRDCQTIFGWIHRQIQTNLLKMVHCLGLFQHEIFFFFASSHLKKTTEKLVHCLGLFSKKTVKSWFIVWASFPKKHWKVGSLFGPLFNTFFFLVTVKSWFIVWASFQQKHFWFIRLSLSALFLFFLSSSSRKKKLILVVIFPFLRFLIPPPPSSFSRIKNPFFATAMHSSVRAALFPEHEVCRWVGWIQANGDSSADAWDLSPVDEGRLTYLIKWFSVKPLKEEAVEFYRAGGDRQQKKPRKDSRRGMPAMLGTDIIDNVTVVIFPNLSFNYWKTSKSQFLHGLWEVQNVKTPEFMPKWSKVFSPVFLFFILFIILFSIFLTFLNRIPPPPPVEFYLLKE